MIILKGNILAKQETLEFKGKVTELLTKRNVQGGNLKIITRF